MAENSSAGSIRENEIAKAIVDAAFRIHSTLGPGLLESVYEVLLAHELRKRGHEILRQHPVPLHYDSITFEEAFRADLIVENLVVVEVKSIQAIERIHKKQLLTYLRLLNKRLGLLVNFGEAVIRTGISRIVNGLPE